MPGPIEKIGAKVIAPQSDVKSGGGVSKFKDIQKNAMPKDAGVKTAAAPEQLPAMKEVTASERKTIERDLRKRLEQNNTQDPAKLFGPDMKDIRKQIDGLSNRVESPGVRDRLAAIEQQFTASEAKLKNIPKTENLRDLLSLQVEMYQMSQNIEILTKVVDSASQGVKQTLQTQV